MTLIEKIKLAAEQNELNLRVTRDEGKLKDWDFKSHALDVHIQLGHAVEKLTLHEAIECEDSPRDKWMFGDMCGHLINTKKGCAWYYFTINDTYTSWSCGFKDGDFTYVVCRNLEDSLILVYK